MDVSLSKMRPDTLHQAPNSATGDQAVLTLTPIECPTDSQPRVLTLHTDYPRLHVGRSSRNASKGLVAARNNAWFDSPTMSRQHASFYMTAKSPGTILLEDLRSTHGTFVQGRRLDVDEAYTCTSGISITFGQKVTSGIMTFPAREFVLGIEWQSPSPPTPSSSPAAQQKTKNVGFCVPEDEDETSADCSREPSVQIVEVSRRTFSVPDSPSSEDVCDSDDDSVEVLPAAGGFSIFTTPDIAAGSGGKGQGPQANHSTEDGLSNHKNLKISCLLTNDDDQIEKEAGTSPLNPIELDKEIARVRRDAMVEIEDDGPEILSSKAAVAPIPPLAPTLSLGHLQQWHLRLHTEHNVDTGEGNGHDVIPDSDMDDFENNLFDEVDDDELYQLTEPHVDGRPPHSEIEHVRAKEMVKFIQQGFDSEDSDDDENEDEDEDDCLNHFNADFEDGQTFLTEGTTNNSSTSSNPQNSFQPDTKQADQEPLVTIEDSQLHVQLPPRISTAAPISVGYPPACMNIDRRAPSPSDAALAKKPPFPRINLSTGENPMHPRAVTQMSVPQSSYDKGYPAGPGVPSGFPLRREFLDNSNAVHNFSNFEDYRGQESIFDDSDHFPRYKVGPFSSRPERCSTLPSLVAACEQSMSNDLRVQQYLGPAASRAKASSVSSNDCVPIRGAGCITEQLKRLQPPVGPSPALSIKDLVDDNHNELPSPLRGLKRKAAEIALDDEITASPEQELMQQTILAQPPLTTSQESFLHDAQPRNTQASSLQDSILQFCNVSPDEPESRTIGSREGPARKKIKTAAKRPGRIGAFISGFVVGGLSLAGAFAALIATIPNSVREETWRELSYSG